MLQGAANGIAGCMVCGCMGIPGTMPPWNMACCCAIGGAIGAAMGCMCCGKHIAGWAIMFGKVCGIC